MDYLDIITQIADNALLNIQKNGHAKAGCNGPYNNQDTPVRNSGHWLIIFSYLYELYKDKRYYNAVRQLAMYLIDEKNYAPCGSIYHRTDIRFDKINGLIGQAWTIEALIEASKFLKEDNYYIMAKNVFKSQDFDNNRSFWIGNDCDGTKFYDITFNHQLWFAASGAMIIEYEKETNKHISDEIRWEIDSFLTASESKYFEVYENGMIKHVGSFTLTPKELEYKRNVARIRKRRSLIANPMKVIMKKIADKLKPFSFTEGLEEGYHIFDLYGFALLKKTFGYHSIFRSNKLSKALKYAFDRDTVLQLEQPCGGFPLNKFAFIYNSPAFEYPYVYKTFKMQCDKNTNLELWNFQLNSIYDKKTKSFCRFTNDPNTLNARMYELIRFLRTDK